MELQNIKKGEGALATMQNVRLELVIAGPWYVVYRKYLILYYVYGFIANEDFWSPYPPLPPYRIDFAKMRKKRKHIEKVGNTQNFHFPL